MEEFNAGKKFLRGNEAFQQAKLCLTELYLVSGLQKTKLSCPDLMLESLQSLLSEEKKLQPVFGFTPEN